MAPGDLYRGIRTLRVRGHAQAIVLPGSGTARRGVYQCTQRTGDQAASYLGVLFENDLGTVIGHEGECSKPLEVRSMLGPVRMGCGHRQQMLRNRVSGRVVSSRALCSGVLAR